MAGVAEVGGAEAEEDGDRAAVAALVLQVVRAVLRTHLGLKMENVNQDYNDRQATVKLMARFIVFH